MLLKPTSDGFDNLRKERNNIMMQASSNSNNNLISSKYLTVTQKADDYEKASANLSRVIADTIQNFKNMGCHAAELSGYERCRSIYEFFIPMNRLISNILICSIQILQQRIMLFQIHLNLQRNLLYAETV